MAKVRFCQKVLSLTCGRPGEEIHIVWGDRDLGCQANSNTKNVKVKGIIPGIEVKPATKVDINGMRKIRGLVT